MGPTVKPQDLLADYINSCNVMQLACCRDNKPYVVNVHYYAAEDGSIYWISTRDRRHSQELEQNPAACATIKVHENTIDEPWVTGLTVEGAVEYVGEDPGPIADEYQQKLGKDEQMMNDIKTGINPHKFYRLVPSRYSLFDTKNFPDNPKQEWDAS
jgi:uncharacterized protein YhbP (UPF0306 family)